MPKTQTAPRKPGVRGLLMEKRGPLPVWAWVALVLVVFVGYLYWRRRTAGAVAAEADTGYQGFPIGGDQAAPPVFIVPQVPPPPITVNPPPAVVVPGQPTPRKPRTPATVPTAPPGGGATPPATPPESVPQGPESYTLQPGSNLYQFVDLVRERHNPAFDFQRLEALNAGLRSRLYWRAGTGSGPYGSDYTKKYGNIPYNKQTETLRIR